MKNPTNKLRSLLRFTRKEERTFMRSHFWLGRESSAHRVKGGKIICSEERPQKRGKGFEGGYVKDMRENLNVRGQFQSVIGDQRRGTGKRRDN